MLLLDASKKRQRFCPQHKKNCNYVIFFLSLYSLVSLSNVGLYLFLMAGRSDEQQQVMLEPLKPHQQSGERIIKLTEDPPPTRIDEQQRVAMEPEDMLEPLKPHQQSGERIKLMGDPPPTRIIPLSPIIDNKNNTSMDKNHPPCEVGLEGPGGRQVLEKVRESLVQSSRQQKQQQEEQSQPRILCLVYTYDGAHENVRAIAQTWGLQCDGFLAASNQTDRSIGAIDLPHEGPEAYTNMWQKIRSMWAYVYDHHMDKYDYFYICGDDMYVVVDHLRAYLTSPQVERLEKDGYMDTFTKHNKEAKRWEKERPRPLLFGLPVVYRKQTYPLGGCGYTLNRAAVTLFVEQGLPTFLPNNTDPREDLFIGSFFWEHGVTTVDIRDSDGAFRCQSMSAEAMFNFDGYRSQALPRQMRERYGVEMLPGMDGVSRENFAFHLRNLKNQNLSIPEQIYRYHALLTTQDTCHNKTLLDDKDSNDTTSSQTLLDEPKTIPTDLYWNLSCPFESSKLSQVFMASIAKERNLINSTEQEEIHGMRRAALARDFALQHDVLGRVHRSFIAGSFNNRRIFFEGDSLMRQLFMSMACLLWGSGHVESKRIEWKEWGQEEYNKMQSHFPGFIRKGEHSMIINANVQLKGQGELVYRDRYPKPGGAMYRGNNPIQNYLNWTEACESNATIIAHGFSLTKKDVVIINGGLHPDRNKQVEAIENLLTKCRGPEYPRFVYMMTPLQHFWTGQGNFDARVLVEDKPTCKKSVPKLQRQYGDINKFKPLAAALLGEHLDQRDLGELQVWRGDCTHWIMPGMHDVLSAEFASLVQNMTTMEQ